MTLVLDLETGQNIITRRLNRPVKDKRIEKEDEQ